MGAELFVCKEDVCTVVGSREISIRGGALVLANNPIRQLYAHCFTEFVPVVEYEDEKFTGLGEVRVAVAGRSYKPDGGAPVSSVRWPVSRLLTEGVPDPAAMG
jgi:hypothetical protein